MQNTILFSSSTIFEKAKLIVSNILYANRIFHYV